MLSKRKRTPAASPAEPAPDALTCCDETLAERDKQWEKAIREVGWYCSGNSTSELIDQCRKRMEQPVERVTISHQKTGVFICVDGDATVEILDERYAEKVAAGLRAELEKEATHA